ncbi:TetR family transcriptional regulator [Pantoea rodasii]|uniref:TetR family transcriptional regulator n=1 Tax=Pantoea rodasii TaxID=1076549 RepID=A0A2M9W7R8_9GAMM|nr:TetR/AcrR family transcriptional regulator [Pantoea rodasii]ORM66250.1 TetR family transcriptional regulator [Pantoea rodasii]PJZ03544.1 TetR family transcriptional regulator [Pantoea rodasii]
MEKLSHKARTRQRILDEASEVMRECGTEGIGVAALMKRAGLTHGGFYAHFDSREALVEAVIATMFADSAQRFAAITQLEDPAERLTQLIDNYLSEQHRNTPGEGCPMPALVSEIAHLPIETRTLFSQRRDAVRQRLAQALNEMHHPQADDVAASMLAEMVGAVALARACPDDEEARNMLAISRRSVKQRAGLVNA